MSTGGLTLLGAGKMAGAFVDRWAQAGRHLTVWNRTPSAAEALARPGVVAVADLDEAVRDAEVVVSILTDGDALRAVHVDGGAPAAMRPGSVLADLSTVDVDASEAVARAATARGVRYVRGAVSGSPVVVRAGTASLLLSGPADALDGAREVLLDLAPTHHLLGEGEQARVVKIAVNAMLGGTLQMLAEAVVVAEASGVERGAFLDALDGTVMANAFLRYKGTALRARDYGATFRTLDARKDLRLAVDLAEVQGIPTPVVSATLARLEAAVDAGYGEDDFLSLVRLEQADAHRPVDGGPGPA